MPRLIFRLVRSPRASAPARRARHTRRTRAQYQPCRHRTQSRRSIASAHTATAGKRKSVCRPTACLTIAASSALSAKRSSQPSTGLIAYPANSRSPFSAASPSRTWLHDTASLNVPDTRGCSKRPMSCSRPHSQARSTSPESIPNDAAIPSHSSATRIVCSRLSAMRASFPPKASTYEPKAFKQAARSIPAIATPACATPSCPPLPCSFERSSRPWCSRSRRRSRARAPRDSCPRRPGPRRYAQPAEGLSQKCRPA